KQSPPHASPPPSAESRPRPLPPPIPDGFRVILETCFLTGERVALSDVNVKADGTRDPGPGDVLDRERWLERISKKDISAFYPSKDGLFIRVNPMKSGGKTDVDVTAFRHTLGDFDLDRNGNRIP